MPSCHGDEGVSPGPADLQDRELPSNALELSTGTTTTPRTDPESRESIFVSQASTMVSDNEESSSGDGWDLTARNGSRNPEDLLKNGLPPVWTSWGGYPGEVPQDIYEWFDDKTGIKNVQCIGPISSLFWLKGHDDLVEVCNDSAYILEDEIRMVPNGTGLGFMIDEYFSEGKIPRRMFFRAMGYEHPLPAHVNVSIARINSLPRNVPRDPRNLPTESIYPLARRQCFPPSVRCFKMQRHKKTPTLLSKIFQKAPDLMTTGELWFRGTGMNAANCNLSFLIPSLSSNAMYNEFGPGLYTTTDLDYAAKYVMEKGAIMVFKNPDLRALNVWEPSPAEWKQLVCTWTQADLPGVSETMPQEYRQADMIRGPISERKQNKMVTAGDKQQLVAVSYKGCERLCASLHTIIYLCTEEEEKL